MYENGSSLKIHHCQLAKTALLSNPFFSNIWYHDFYSKCTTLFEV